MDSIKIEFSAKDIANIMKESIKDSVSEKLF